MILKEHVKLDSSLVILSRSFDDLLKKIFKVLKILFRIEEKT